MCVLFKTPLRAIHLTLKSTFLFQLSTSTVILVADVTGHLKYTRHSAKSLICIISVLHATNMCRKQYFYLHSTDEKLRSRVHAHSQSESPGIDSYKFRDLVCVLSLTRRQAQKGRDQGARWLSQLSIRLLILAQVRVSGLWDWARIGSVESLLEMLSLPLALLLFTLSLFNK